MLTYRIFRAKKDSGSIRLKVRFEEVLTGKAWSNNIKGFLPRFPPRQDYQKIIQFNTICVEAIFCAFNRLNFKIFKGCPINLTCPAPLFPKE